MASGTLDWVLTGTYQLISGAEVQVGGIVNSGSVEFWYGVQGAQGTNKGGIVQAGWPFSFKIGSGDGLYAKLPSGVTNGSLTIWRSAT